MLILGRRVGDAIYIDGTIRVVVVSCDRGGVRLGIEAPEHVRILRGEIANQVAEENQRASAVPANSPWLAAVGVPKPPVAAPAPQSPAA
ncbi:MAG: carbon storage regulator CsrA [Gemmatimonadetes bacterium]|nr:carbon storage regulator CsrA [Gemmatimonadota bacterium]